MITQLNLPHLETLELRIILCLLSSLRDFTKLVGLRNLGLHSLGNWGKVEFGLEAFPSCQTRGFLNVDLRSNGVDEETVRAFREKCFRLKIYN